MTTFMLFGSEEERAVAKRMIHELFDKTEEVCVCVCVCGGCLRIMPFTVCRARMLLTQKKRGFRTRDKTDRKWCMIRNTLLPPPYEEEKRIKREKDREWQKEKKAR